MSSVINDMLYLVLRHCWVRLRKVIHIPWPSLHQRAQPLHSFWLYGQALCSKLQGTDAALAAKVSLSWKTPILSFLTMFGTITGCRVLPCLHLKKHWKYSTFAVLVNGVSSMSEKEVQKDYACKTVEIVALEAKIVSSPQCDYLFFYTMQSEMNLNHNIALNVSHINRDTKMWVRLLYVIVSAEMSDITKISKMWVHLVCFTIIVEMKILCCEKGLIIPARVVKYLPERCETLLGCRLAISSEITNTCASGAEHCQRWDV